MLRELGIRSAVMQPRNIAGGAWPDGKCRGSHRWYFGRHLARLPGYGRARTQYPNLAQGCRRDRSTLRYASTTRTCDVRIARCGIYISGLGPSHRRCNAARPRITCRTGIYGAGIGFDLGTAHPRAWHRTRGPARCLRLNRRRYRLCTLSAAPGDSARHVCAFHRGGFHVTALRAR